MQGKDSVTYRAGDLAVTWKPGLCVHSARCVRGLPAVFDPARRPWVDMEAATAAEIEAQVAKCPSGALTSRREGPG